MSQRAPSSFFAWVFANGELADPNALRELIRPGDWLVAADGGARHLARLGLKPALLVGDLDSLTPEEVTTFAAGGTEVHRYPPEKDETDLELTLQWVLQAGCTSIRIAGALGGRLDQTLGNLALLSQPQLSGPESGIDCRIEDGHEEVFFIHHQAQIQGQAGDIVSLIPWGGPAVGVLTTDLRYPLHRETLFVDRSRGISNEMCGSTAQVCLENGVLLCIHTRTHPHSKETIS